MLPAARRTAHRFGERRAAPRDEPLEILELSAHTRSEKQGNGDMKDNYEQWVDRLIEHEEREQIAQIKAGAAHRAWSAEYVRKLEKAEVKLKHEFEVHSFANREFEREPIDEVPDEVKLPADYFDEVAHKVNYNEVYVEHYRQRYEDTNKESYRSMSERIAGCHRSWFGDHYRTAKVFNVKRVFHCHSRWCWLCTHLKQAKRLYKFHQIFASLLKQYDLYHLVFTIRNVAGMDLKDSIKREHNGLKKLIRYFQGKAKIKGLDFSQYGWIGALRSFEIVINPTDYHPHLHVLFTLKKGLEFPKTKINKYSFSNGVLVRKFSEFEILMQKIFYLVYNGKKVTLENIKKTKLGYSCTADCVEDNAWHEVFKYATKMSKDGASTCTYEQFCLLDDILRRMKMLQGYGIFYDMDEVEDEKDPTAEILFEKVLIMLEKIERPERDVHIELNKLVDELHEKGLTVISKKMSYKYLQAVVEDLRAELRLEYDFAPF